MNIVIDTNVVSPHIAPLSLELARINSGNLKYVYYGRPSDAFRSREVYDQIKSIAVDVNGDRDKARSLADNADFVLENVRDFDLMERRANAGKLTAYMSERWFKPVRLDAMRGTERASGRGIYVPGFLKMLLPFAIKRARRMMRLMRSDCFLYLPNGIIAARDMARMCGLMNGDWRCIFRSPRLEFESKAGGRIWACDGKDEVYCTDRMRMWGYLVSSSTACAREPDNEDGQNVFRILWVGRIFALKRIEDVIYAVRAYVELKRGGAALRDVVFDVVGDGPDKERLQRIVAKWNLGDYVRFLPSVPLSEVRELMREHEVYVLSSNAFEGWGAVVNEALEEGMKVVGTYEAGASATVLPDCNLYHAGDWRRLSEMLSHPIADVGIGGWNVRRAARALLDIVEKWRGK